MIGENIRKLRERRGFTQSELATRVGLRSYTSISKWEKGKSEPRAGMLNKIAFVLGATIDEITTDSLYEDALQTHAVSSNAHRIPVFSCVHAGVALEAIDDVVDYEEIPKEMTSGGREYFGVVVKGDCMEPEYREGDTVIVLKQPDCESGQDAIVYVNGYDAELRKIVKRSTGIMLQPLNHAYEPDIYHYNDPDNPVTIVGIVVEIRRKK
jgi:repressor LexA